MTKKTTRAEEYLADRRTLFVVFELGWTEWKLGFSTGMGQRPRRRRIAARDCGEVQWEIAEAKRRFGLPPDVRNSSPYPV